MACPPRVRRCSGQGAHLSRDRDSAPVIPQRAELHEFTISTSRISFSSTLSTAAGISIHRRRTSHCGKTRPGSSASRAPSLQLLQHKTVAGRASDRAVPPLRHRSHRCTPHGRPRLPCGLARKHVRHPPCLRVAFGAPLRSSPASAGSPQRRAGSESAAIGTGPQALAAERGMRPALPRADPNPRNDAHPVQDLRLPREHRPVHRTDDPAQPPGPVLLSPRA